MDQLPIELCSYVCQYLDFADLKAVRLCCTRYNTAGSKWLFREIVVYMNRESLDKVKNISQAHHLTSSIRKLSVYCDHCPKLTFGSFKITYRRLVRGLYVKRVRESEEMVQKQAALEQAKQNQSYAVQFTMDHEFSEHIIDTAERLVSIDKPEKELQRAHKHYQNLAQEGIRMQSDSSIRKVLGLLFLECTNLASIYVTLVSSICVSTTDHASKQFRKGLVCPLGQPLESKFGVCVMEQIIQAAQDAQSNFEFLCLTNISRSIMRRCAATLPLVLKSLTDLSWSFPYADQRVLLKRDLDIGDNDDGDIYYNYDDNNDDNEDEDEDEDNDDDERLVDWGNLSPTARYVNLRLYKTLIKHLNKLRSLTLEFTPIFWYIGSMPELRLIVNNDVFPNLRSLRLKWLQSTSTDIFDFLLRHANSLQSVHFENISLTDGTWSRLLQDLKGELPKLVKFDLRGRLQDGGTNGSSIWENLDSAEDIVQQISDYIRFDTVDWPVSLSTAGIYDTIEDV